MTGSAGITVVLTMTITGALSEPARGWRDPKLVRRGLAVVCFAVGAVSGGLLVLNVGLTAALGLGLCILVLVAIRLPSRVRIPHELVSAALGMSPQP